MVTQMMAPKRPGESTMEDTRRAIILPERPIAFPTTDVISYAFAEYGAYNVDKPVRLWAFNGAKKLAAE